VGDSPPHMDYANETQYPASCRKAARRDIVINTIQCGSNGETTPIWKKIAILAEGRFFRVEQSGASIIAETPFDAQLADLSRQLDNTRVFYGSRDKREQQAERKMRASKVMAESSAPALAQRAAYNASAAGAANLGGKGGELLADVESESVDLDGVKTDELPKEMQKMSKDERKVYVKGKQKERERIQQKIRELTQQRQAWFKKHKAEKGLSDKNSFDSNVYECIREQAGRKNIHYSDDMVY